ncbi:hypothetical protein D0C36_20730 [Mucilaginibacter conchicola]|uniref:Uncharacterized protein n=1 Tax=Mucilaginibacter conchicola TaxID=2303333 RepID=A0A372NNP8_9SPHI|nr:hypothetical protein [Mucilaginibacter conchicola]RFZ90227.1 hypothetical protein D0C36_20730 [Mucilaginibacter conchicola]
MMKIIFFAVIISMFFSACSEKKAPVLAPEYLFHEEGQKVITSLINDKIGTISIIYGNEGAFRSALDPVKNHVSGERYIMVTWKQKPMPHWYGTDMNGPIISVETVITRSDQAGRVSFDYSSALCNGKLLDSKDKDHNHRARFIADQPAAVFP